MSVTGLLKHRVPTSIFAAIVGLCVGGAAGAYTMLALGYRKPEPVQAPDAEAEAAKKKERMAKIKARRQRFLDRLAKHKLTVLVKRLDLLTTETSPLQLTAKQRVKIAEHIDGLAKLQTLGPDEARKRYAAIVGELKDHAKLLQAAGVYAPGDRRQFSEWKTENPFKKGENKDRLKSLQERFPRKS